MIAVQKIIDKALAYLDATGSQRYTFDLDFKPNLNSALEIVVTMLNEAFGEKKLVPECLRDLTKVKIWQTNAYSRFSYSDAQVGYPLWTVLAIYPKPIVNKGVGPIPVSDPSESKFRSDISFVSSNYDCKRLTFEEWNVNRENTFMPGNVIIKGSLIDYAYLDMADYSSSSYAGNPGQREITIRPDVSKELVAMAFLKYPNQVNLITDSIEFPETMTDLITRIMLQCAAVKQGDKTTLYGTSSQMMNMMLSALT